MPVLRLLRLAFCFLGLLLLLLPPAAAAAEETAPVPLLRLGIVELRTQGGLEPEELRPLLQALLPAVLDCVTLNARSGEVQEGQLLLRFNLNPQGRVAWFKLFHPSRRLESCLSRLWQQQSWPPAWKTTRVYLVLGLKPDHLLNP